jgi:IclR family transcriptional regulator, KDG regulon repressor
VEKDTMKKPKGDYAIQAVINAIRLLETFRDEEEQGVTSLAKRLDLHKNNVFRLLATLEQLGYIEQCAESDRYRLGVRSLELGQSFGRSRNLLRRARPVLDELALTCGESTHLGLLRDMQVVHVEGRSPERLVLTGTRVGRALPAHCTALGKVLLGCSPSGVLESFDRKIVAGGNLPKLTSATICDPAKFFEHLRTVAVRGYALDLEECEPGLSCAAAPIFDGDGELVAAISISGPSFRISEERIQDEIVPLVVAAADQLSRELGFAAS